jgi:dTDP-4-dehydrorhamnose 3,5-epimerase
MIEGVLVKQFRQILDERGKVMHMIRNDDPDFLGFGEIYFLSICPGVIKGWHLHKKMTLNYAVPYGTIKQPWCFNQSKGEQMVACRK